MAIQIGAGNLGGAMASNFYRAADGPRYILGHALELGFISFGILAALIMLLGFSRINRERERAMGRGEPTCSEEELARRGDKAVTFRYMY
jgi:hypothetical protein